MDGGFVQRHALCVYILCIYTVFVRLPAKKYAFFTLVFCLFLLLFLNEIDYFFRKIRKKCAQLLRN